MGSDEAPAERVTRPKKNSRRRRALWITTGVLAAGVIAVTFAVRSPSSVGHWNSADGQANFMAAYDAAMADMPPAATTFDVRTDFGFVRVYRFEGTPDRAEPLVLLPGRASESVFQGGTVKVYPDASHAINGEYPAEVAADIAAFLDAH